jgi:hypothetical protein
MNRILGALGTVVLFAFYLAWTFYPNMPVSATGWVALIVLGVPVCMFIEWLSERVLCSEFIKKSSSFTRIIFGVLFLGILFVISMLVQPLLKTVVG